MKIVVAGGTGQIGAGVVERLRSRGHEAVAASRSTGFDVLTGAGVTEALTGADVVLDTTNAPDPAESITFFGTASATLLAAEATAGVTHHVLLSIVGIDRPHDLAYYRGKLAQEEAVRASGRPYTIVRATQFIGFTRMLIDASGDPARLPATMVQPVAVADLQDELAAILTAPPVNGIVEVGGPTAYRMDDLARLMFPGREVITDPDARPFLGATISERMLLPGPGARLGSTTVDAAGSY